MEKLVSFTPLHDRVLILPLEEKQSGLIIAPDSAKERPLQGRVLAVGAGTRNAGGTLIPLQVKPGDRVLYGKYSGTDIKMDGEPVIIAKEEEIYGIFVEGPVAVAEPEAFCEAAWRDTRGFP